MRKAVKAKLVDCFHMDETNLNDLLTHPSLGYLWRLATPTASDREKKYQFTWGDYTEKIFNMIVQRHSHSKEHHLINDCYDVEF